MSREGAISVGYALDLFSEMAGMREWSPLMIFCTSQPSKMIQNMKVDLHFIYLT
jgi:hypothetical protein